MDPANVTDRIRHLVGTLLLERESLLAQLEIQQRELVELRARVSNGPPQTQSAVAVASQSGVVMRPTTF
jgi:hypothetical protein